MWYWIIGVALVVLALIGARFSLHHRLNTKSRGGGVDPEVAEALRQASRDIDRGRGASQGFFF